MDEHNSEKKTVRSKFSGKFGVSENIHVRKYSQAPREDREDRGGERGERRSFGERGERRSFGDRKPFGDRGERRSFGDRKPFGDRGERRSFGDREERGERRSFGDRKPFGNRGERRSFGDRKPFGRKSFGDRGERRPFAEDEKREPVFRQRPELQPEPDFSQKDEAVLEANAVAAQVAPEETTPAWFKKVLTLTTEKGREREGNFLGEGIHVVQELVSNHADQVIGVYCVEGFSDTVLLDQIKEAGIRLHDVPEELMQKASTTVTSQGIFAVCRQASRRPDYDSARSIITIVDAVQDPGNLGTLFRTSLGFNSDGMILGKGTVSAFNPKVVRGSSGTFLSVPFESDMDLIERINFLHSKGYTIVATDLHAKQSLQELPKNKLRKIAFLVGNEGAGTNSYLIELADETVKIPMSSELESLNVAVAHGILSYEIAKLQQEL